MSYFGQSPFANITPVVKNLIIVNCIFSLATWVLGRQGIDLVGTFAAFYFNSANFKIWQVVTYMFMHDPNNIFHLIFNMYTLLIFGPMLEHYMGPKRFFNFYFLTGFGALAMQMLVSGLGVYHLVGSFTIPGGNPAYYSAYDGIYTQLQDIYTGPVLGASGAIFGILVGFGTIFPNAEMMIIPIPIPIKAKYLIIAYVAFEVSEGFGITHLMGGNIAHFAHIGGGLTGFILVRLWGLHKHNNFFN